MRKALLSCLLLALLLPAAGCAAKTGPHDAPAAPGPSQPTASVQGGTPPEGETADARAALTLACTALEGSYDPFFAEKAGDRLVLRLTQTRLLALKADGSAAAEPESRDALTGAAAMRLTRKDDGSALLRLSLREDIRFSDGSYADVDDLLFTLYVLLDPDYDGPLSLDRLAISGLARYRTQTDEALYVKYSALYDRAADGDGDYAAEAARYIREDWYAAIGELTVLCQEKYLDTYAHYALGLGAEEAAADQGLRLAFTLWCAGLAESVDRRGILWDAAGNGWDLAHGQRPDLDAAYRLFAGNYPTPEAFDQAMGTAVSQRARERFIRDLAAADPAYQGGPTGIQGISRVDDYTLELQLMAYSASDLAQLRQVYLASRRHYGDGTDFAPQQGRYGFAFGELDGVRAKATQPQPGAGAYAISDQKQGAPSFAANPFYYKGAAKTGSLRLYTCAEETLLDAVARGQADAALLQGSRDCFDRARKLNGGPLSGEALTALPIATDAYGYVAVDPAGLPQGLAQALLPVLGWCCRISALDYYGDVVQPVTAETTWEKVEAALVQRLAQVALPAAGLTLEALLPGDGLGDHPCYAGFKMAQSRLAPYGITLLIRDLSEDSFWTALDRGEADVWAAAQYGGDLAAGEKLLVYKKQDLAVFSPRRVDVSSLPKSQTVYLDWIDMIEMLALR